MKRFFDYVLRTTDAPAARTFYSDVLGNSGANIVPLHEQALARGARPHWLGFVDAGDVGSAASGFAARGAAALGPKWVNPEGLEAAVMRDPGGALVALAKPPPAAPRVPGIDVCWHLLHTADVERAKVNYGELFGWAFEAPVDLESLGVFHPFAWQSGVSQAGAMSDIRDRPGVHAHWLFHIRVASFDRAVDAVRGGGGAVATVRPPGGARVAVCDDPQGAAFALWEGDAGGPSLTR